MIKNRLVAYGMIRKGRHGRYLMVLLDERLQSGGAATRTATVDQVLLQHALRPASGPVTRFN